MPCTAPCADVGKETIADAINAWEEATCIRFQRVESTANVTGSHILFQPHPLL
jgi:hypothetical protein